MSEPINLIYVTLNQQNIAIGMTESYTLPPGNVVSLGRIPWSEVDFSIHGKLWDGENWISLDSVVPSKPDDDNDYVWSEERQAWITLEEFEELLSVE